MWRFVFISFVVWRIALVLVGWVGSFIIPQRIGFLGSIPWVNFDGIYYLLIAERGYGLYQHAFFPLFPALISLLAPVFGGNYLISSLFLIHTSLIIALILFWKLVAIDFDTNVSRWTCIFLLIFPTSFFLGSVYTESLFLLLVFGSFYAARKKRWFVAGILGTLAAATKLVGIFVLPALLIEFFLQQKGALILYSIKVLLRRAWGALLVPLGLLSYMYYLNNKIGDPLAFLHSQPAFGANRSGNEIILLPQVVYRYIKIFLTVPVINYDYWIALLEIVSFFVALFVLILSIRKIRLSYLVFSLLSILTPTLTGTFSSMPRYVLAAFPILILMSIQNKMVKLLLCIGSLLLSIILGMLFARGYFIA